MPKRHHHAEYCPKDEQDEAVENSVEHVTRLLSRRDDVQQAVVAASDGDLEVRIHQGDNARSVLAEVSLYGEAVIRQECLCVCERSL